MPTVEPEAAPVDAVLARTPTVRASTSGDRPDTEANGRLWPRSSVQRWRRLRYGGAVIVGLWTIGLLFLSSLTYHRNFLGEDFATYNQAWTLIGQGHLNPYDSIYGFPFIKADFELIMWPLALIHLIVPQSFALLAVQDLAIGGTGLVTFVWITEFLQHKHVRWGPAVTVSIVALVVFMANPGVYGVLAFDFHMEPLATLFVVLAGRDLWNGRFRRTWVWVGLALLCGSFAAIMVAGLGVSALLAGRQTRRAGCYLIAIGLAWTGLISVLHANLGSAIYLYAYLAGRKTLKGSDGVTLILGGIITHPWRVTDQLHKRLADAYTLIKPVGIVGLATAWGFGVPVTVMVIDALNSDPDFLRDPFQNFSVYPFVLLGTVMVLVWVAQRFTRGWIAAAVVGGVVTVQALSYGYSQSPATIRWTAAQVSPAGAAELRTALARTPPGAEVIASLRTMGRFCGRQWCYIFVPGGSTVVHSHDVVFVFNTPNEALTTPAGSEAAIAYVRNDLHARVLTEGAGVVAFDWSPPPGTTEVTIPKSVQSR